MENEVTKSKTLGNVIRDVRRAKHWRQSEMAKRLKITIPTISKIERSEIDITIGRLQQIAKIYEVPISKLLGESIDKAYQPDLTELTHLQEQLSLRTEQYLSLQSHFVEMLMKLDKLKETPLK
jgi:transcriptional regulator with XRE-family HTH domain